MPVTQWITILIIAVGLAMDVFAVSLGIGTTQQANGLRPTFRLSFHMGLFQGGMTLLGWLMGQLVVELIAGIDHWVAMILLTFVGVRMIRSGLSSESETHRDDPSRGFNLVILSVATSIDALAVGLSMALISANILASSLLIALVSSALSIIGLRIGDRLGKHFGKRMEVLGGLLLIGIGVRIVIGHISG